MELREDRKRQLWGDEMKGFKMKTLHLVLLAGKCLVYNSWERITVTSYQIPGSWRGQGNKTKWQLIWLKKNGRDSVWYLRQTRRGKCSSVSCVSSFKAVRQTAARHSLTEGGLGSFICLRSLIVCYLPFTNKWEMFVHSHSYTNTWPGLALRKPLLFPHAPPLTASSSLLGIAGERAT